jgi:hypothetical protein
MGSESQWKIFGRILAKKRADFRVTAWDRRETASSPLPSPPVEERENEENSRPTNREMFE